MDPYNTYHPYYRMGNGIRKDTQMHPTMPYPDARTDTSVVQSRILELRKEKSRDAARSRRGKENHEFYELAKMLPLPAAITSQLDKASIIRLTISYLKLREFALNGLPTWSFPSFGHLNAPSANVLKNKICHAFDSQQGQHILQSLDGFMFLLGQDGRFLYISETVSIYLGLSQTEVIGSSIFDYCHQADHAELALNLGLTQTNLNQNSKKNLNGKHNNFNLNGNSCSPLPPSSVCSNGSADSDPSSFQQFNSSIHSPTSYFGSNNNQLINSGDKLERQFCIRIKSALSKRGCQHFKSSGYRVVQIIAHLRPQLINNDQRALIESNLENTNSNLKSIGLVAVAICLPAPTVNDLRLESDTFVMRLGLDFRIVHCEPKVSELFDYNADELVNRNLYGLVHCQDMAYLRKAHIELIHKGQIMTRYYRIINKNGGYTWIQSCATLISNSLQPNTPPVPANHSTDTPSPTLNAGSPNSQNGSSGAKNVANSLNSSSSNLSSNEEQFEQSIICINYVISKLESENLILDSSQLPENQNKLKQQRSLNKLQLAHSAPSPPLLQPPTKKMVNNSKRSINLQSSNNNSTANLASPTGSTATNSSSSNGGLTLNCTIKQSPSNSPCLSPSTNNNSQLRHTQLLPIHHSSTNSDEDIPCNNENNHNTMNSVELLTTANNQQQPTADLKRRRYAASSSPVRPWKNTPSPISNQIQHHTEVAANMTNALISTQHLLLGTANSNQITNNGLHNLTNQTQLNPLINSTTSLICSSPESVCSSSSLNGSSMANNSNLLRHISVIRETPPAILKPQLVPAYHQQSYSASSLNHNQLHNHHSNRIEHHHPNHLMTNIQHQQLTHELNSQLTNGHSNNLINTHHNVSPVQMDHHLGLAGISSNSNSMTQHLIQQQQSTNAPLLTTSSNMPVATVQSYHNATTANNLISSHSHHHHSSSLHNGSQSAANLSNIGLNTSASSSNSTTSAIEHASLMHQALTANVNHHLTHANYTNHLTNQLTHAHHATLVDPSSLVDPYSYNAAAAVLHHHWYN